MKDNLAFACLLAAVLLAVVSAWPPASPGLVRPVLAGQADTLKGEIRYIEPVTVIGRRESLADESLASAEGDAVKPAVPTHPHQHNR